MKRIIHWFRRDFRITDNTALAAAVAAAGPDGEVIPVYIATGRARMNGPARRVKNSSAAPSLH